MSKIVVADLPPNITSWKFLFLIIRPYYFWIFVTCFLISLSEILGIATAYVMRNIIDSANSVVTGGEMLVLWYTAGLYILVSLFASIFWRLANTTGMRFTPMLTADARRSLTSYVTLHSQTYFSDRFSGAVSSNVSQAAESTGEIAEQTIYQFLGFFVSLSASFMFAFSANMLVAFIFLFWVVCLIVLNTYYAKKIMPISANVQRAGSAVSGTTIDLITNMHAVDEYGRRTFELNRLSSFIEEERLARLSRWKFREKTRLVNNILQTLFIGGMVLVSIYFVSKKIISAGDLTMIFAIIMMIEGRIQHMSYQMSNFGKVWGQLKESLENIVIPYDMVDKVGAEELAGAKGEISFSNVSFSYDNSLVLADLSLHIPAGQKVGLVGRSGAGKSTFIKLLLRHHDVTSGAISLDEKNISNLTRDSLRQAIAVVPQEPMLFHRSIKENIAYGNVNASEEEVIKAAILAEAHGFIEKLPEGYASLVGERGVKLSGGQRQRVAIARAMLKEAPILLLDEATSALDSESEVAVQKALSVLMKNRTVIAIAHRLSTLRVMDRIIVMDQGKIIEDGTHAELLGRGSLYSELWNHQAGGFLSE